MENTLELHKKIKKLEAELAKYKSNQKYGLIWEDSPEKLDDPSIIPLLREVKEKRIEMIEDGEQNYLIEGDNYHALKALQHTHKGKVDVIYIDPPYNTGNEFVYNDKIVDKEDGYRHSKWLSFMAKRLKLAQRLLSDEGVIFVSIDDNEQAQLKLLMDSIFGEQNFVSTIIWNTKGEAKGIPPKTMIANNHEYILAYSKKIGYKFIGELREEKDGFTNTDNDPRGGWKRQYLQRFNQGFPIRKIKNPITKEVYEFETPYTEEKMQKWVEEGRIIFPSKKGGYPARKEFFNEYKNPYKPILSNWGLYSTKVNTEQVKEIFGGVSKFDYTKPLDLIKDILLKSINKNATVLDFFAGSGTTGHAVLELNKEDGGNRKFILCTNNEVSEEKVRQHFMKQGLLDKNNKTAFNKFKKENEQLVQEFMDSEAYQELGIARSVTYERNRKVIQGYTTPKGVEVEGIAANLRYLETVEYDRMGIMFPFIRDQVFEDVKNLHELAFPPTEYDNYYIQMYDEIELAYKGKPMTVLLSGNEKENELIINHIAHLGHKNITYRTIESYA